MHLFGVHQSSSQSKPPTDSAVEAAPGAPSPLRVASKYAAQSQTLDGAYPGPYRSNHYRPAAIAELAAQARANLWDPFKDLRHWLRTAESSRRTAEVHRQSKDYDTAFVEFAKAATLILEKIPTHTEYQTLLNANQRHNLLMNGQDILDSLSQLRFIIVKRHENWQREERESASPGPASFAKQQLTHRKEHSREAPKAACGDDTQLFTCGICLESHRNDFLAYTMPCGHLYCRQCLKGYAVSKIEEHRYPIPCPGCSADMNRSEPAELDDLAIHHLGLSEEEYQVFNKMQMAPFSTIIHCRKCLNTIFVDKEEYQAAHQLIACPLPGCNHVWCKSCSQTIEASKGPRHSCDGSSEFNHLLRQRGWKHCPGCKTPAEKIDGCNHMTCVSPGCNTHFCYLCGELITQSVLRMTIRSEVSRHYGSRCTLF